MYNGAARRTIRVLRLTPGDVARHSPDVARVLFFFVDGVGLGPDDPDVNPLVRARLPTLQRLLDGRRPVAATAGTRTRTASLLGLDATLGVDGIPQSGTGHATLLTGIDAVRRFGRHHGPWVPTALRPLVAERSVLARAKAAGRSVAFANAYPEELIRRVRLEPGAQSGLAAIGRRLGPLRAGPPLAALGAGLLTRHTDHLRDGEAVASEITNDGWIERLGRTSLPRVSPEAAGASLSRIAAKHDLTLFAHYSTDHVGHRGTLEEAVAAMERVDRFLGGLLEALPPDTLLVVASDHGNLEEMGRQHTRAPALGLVAGDRHPEVADALHDLRDVTPAILRRLGIESGDG